MITHPYLNTMLIGLESSNAGFLSASIFGGMLIYLLLCTLKGSFKCGLRIPFLFKLHPMKLFYFNSDWMKHLWILSFSMFFLFWFAVSVWLSSVFKYFLIIVDSQQSICFLATKLPTSNSSNIFTKTMCLDIFS